MHSFSDIRGPTGSGENSQSDSDLVEPIAVIGFAMRTSGEASSASSFWNMLVEGRSAASKFPSDRINIDAFYDEKVHTGGQLSMREGHFIGDDIQVFDAGFFNISPAEAAAMDPMQRILLETAYHGFENAGLSMEQLVGSNTSVYTGCFTADYLIQLVKDPLTIPTYAATGVGASILANRISWFFDLKGPSVNLDSACASTGMAVDLACESLRGKTCNMSVVGGCNITTSPEYFSMLVNLNMLSKDGRCKSFDESANGYARGEGFGVVILKRLEDAIADGDCIRAVIRATGCNHNGRTPAITQPSSAAQERLIRETYRGAGLSMEPTRFCETHGTGTALGDPTEAMGLGKAFRGARTPSDPLILGAVKSNIGHLEGASGIAGLIKSILILEKAIIPPNVNFKSLNPKIDPSYLSIKIPQQAIPWPTGGLRRISVNSFGFGGSNSHMVVDDAFNFLRLRNLRGRHRTTRLPPNIKGQGRIEEPPYMNGVSGDVMNGQGLHGDGLNEIGPCTDDIYRLSKHISGHASETESAMSRVLCFSGNTKASLSSVIASYEKFAVDATPRPDLPSIADIAYTLDSRRTHFPWRTHLVATSADDLIHASSRASAPRKAIGTIPRLGFVFTGQGAQWHGMGRELMVFPSFRNSITNAHKHMETLGCPWSVIKYTHFFPCMFIDSRRMNIDDPCKSQTLCTVLQVGLVDLLQYFGVTPCAVVGHSSGEIAAAYASGSITKEAAWELAYYRGYFAADLPNRTPYQGRMLAVGLSEEEVRPYFSRVETSHSGPWSLRVACYNSPNSITVSGSSTQIEELRVLLDRASVFNRLLRVPVAYHSPQMEVIATDYQTAMGTLFKGKMRVPMVSSVTGNTTSAAALQTMEYWVGNMVSPVLFSKALEAMCAKSPKSVTPKLDRSHHFACAVDVLIEVGPHAALKGPIRDILKQSPRGSEMEYDFLMSRNQSAVESTQGLCGRLHCAGYRLNLRRVNDPEAIPRALVVDLPPFPFARSQSYTHESRINRDYRLRKHGHVEFLGTPSLDWCDLMPQWRCFLRSKEMPWVEDHKINGATVYPAAGMLVMAAEAARQFTLSEGEIAGYQLRNVTFSSAMNIPPSPGELETRTSLRLISKDDHSYEFILCSVQEHLGWIENSRGTIQVYFKDECGGRTCELVPQFEADRSKFVTDCKSVLDAGRFYQFLHEIGYGYGAAFRRNQTILHDEQHEKVVGQTLPLTTSRDQGAIIHPATLDAILHLEFAALFEGATKRSGTFILTGVQSLWLANEGLHTKGSSLNVLTHLDHSGRHKPTSCQVLNGKWNKMLMRADGIEVTMVAGVDAKSLFAPEKEHVLNYISSKIDLDLLDADRIQKYLTDTYPAAHVPTEKRRLLRGFVRSALRKTHDEFAARGLCTTEPHLTSYLDWAKDEVRRCDSDLLDITTTMVRDVENTGAEGRLLFQLSNHLVDILSGKLSPAEILFRNDRLVSDFYLEQVNSEVYFQRALACLDLMAHKNPRMRILEIGGGTGHLTSLILRTLQGEESGLLRCASYAFTDKSQSFVEGARTRFAEYGPKIDACVFDIDHDPTPQGFSEGSYDLIIAISVLHVAQDLNGTLVNVRGLLRRGGRLLLHEGTSPHDPSQNFVWGVFPEWWNNERGRQKSTPLLNERQWHEILTTSGFTGTEIVLPDYEDAEAHMRSFMISTAMENGLGHDSSKKAPHLLRIMVDPSSSTQRHTAEALRSHLHRAAAIGSEILSIQEVLNISDLRKAPCISLLELRQSFLATMNEKDYYSLQELLKKTDTLIWVTHGGGEVPKQYGYGMVDGFARSFRLEAAHLKFVTLALDPINPMATTQHDMILQVFAKTSQHESYEHELTEKGGMLHIHRVVEASTLKQEFLGRMKRELRVEKLLRDSPPIKLSIGAPGQLETLGYTTEKLTLVDRSPDLDDDEVEIEVRAVGLDKFDHLVSSGRTECTSFGRDCAGIVTRAGSGSDLEPGQRVWMYSPEKCASIARSSKHSVLVLPDSVSFEQVCAIPDDIIAAHHLCEAAHLVSGNTVLINARGSLRKALVQLITKIGATIFLLAYSPEDKTTIQDELLAPSAQIFLSRSPFNHELEKQTSGSGVDVVLDAHADAACMEALSPFGTYVNIASNEVSAPAPPSSDNISTFNVNYRRLAMSKPKLLRPALLRALDFAASIEPSSLQSFASSDIVDAFKFLQSMEQGHKIVLTFGREDLLQITVPTLQEYSLDPKGTYILSGAFGGLGRSVVRWLAEKGAKHLILLSRSGPQTEEALALVLELRNRGVIIATPSCDVTDPESVQETVKSLEGVMPTIRGCVHLAVSGRDMIFEKMSYSAWSDRTSAKVHGTVNLYNSLPENLDFFIMTASVGGVVGLISMTAYSAGNAFQDDFSRYLVGKGKKAVAIDYGPAEDLGMLAGQDGMFHRLMQTNQYTAVSDKELLALLEYYCNPTVVIQKQHEAQPIIGLQPPARILAKGLAVPDGMLHPFWSHMYETEGADAIDAQHTPSHESRIDNIRDRLRDADSAEKAAQIVMDALIQRVSTIMSTPEDQLEVNQPIHSYGFDSLTAVELRNWVSTTFQHDIALFEILGDTSLSSLSNAIAKRHQAKEETV